MQPQDYPPALIARFWMKVKPDSSGCWEWTASKRNGYGQFGASARHIEPAHRVAYELLIGPIPNGLVIDHLCRNTACCNPEHMEPVTNVENVMRGEGFAPGNAAKETCIRGHLLSGPNVYIHPTRGSRQCRICRKVYQREYKRRHRSAHDPLTER